MIDKMAHLIAFAVSLITLSSCAAAPPIKSLPAKLTLEQYKQSGEIEQEQTLDSRDPVYLKLAELITSKEVRWSKSMTTYKTGPYILRGDGLIVRCYSNMLVFDVSSATSSASYELRVTGVLGLLGLPDSRSKAKRAKSD